MAISNYKNCDRIFFRFTRHLPRYLLVSSIHRPLFILILSSRSFSVGTQLNHINSSWQWRLLLQHTRKVKLSVLTFDDRGQYSRLITRRPLYYSLAMVLVPWTTRWRILPWHQRIIATIIRSTRYWVIRILWWAFSWPLHSRAWFPFYKVSGHKMILSWDYHLPPHQATTTATMAQWFRPSRERSRRLPLMQP